MTGKARDISGGVTEDGILPGKIEKISGLVQIYLIGLLTTEIVLLCCGGNAAKVKVVRMISKIELHEAAESK